MHIQELLEQTGLEETMDNPYPVSLERTSNGYSSQVKLPDGTSLDIFFKEQGGDPEEYHVEFKRDSSWKITGSGDAQRVFATVLSAIFKFLSQHKPRLITFAAVKQSLSGAGPSRAKLYTRMVNRYASQAGYDVYIEDQGDQVVFELTRQDS